MDIDGLLVREQVENLLASGVRWRVSFCGMHEQIEEGSGLASFPQVVLSEVPTSAAIRKLRRGSKSRPTYAFARLVEDESGRLLDVEEG